MFVRKIEDVENIDRIPGVKNRLMYSPKEGALTLITRIIEVEPHTTFPLHAHNWEHQGITLAGHGKLVGKDIELDMEPGGVHFVPANEPHSIVNRGNELYRAL